MALIFVAGCATTTVTPEGPTGGPTGESTGGPLPPNWSANGSPAGPAIQRTNPPGRPVFIPKLPPAIKIAKPAPVVTWTSLDQWAAEQKIASPRRLAESPMTEYAISSKNGTLVLGIGSREATWRGTEISLGFAPEFIDGEVFVHGLDLKKNFEPLLCGEPLAFPAAHRVIVIDPGHGGMNSGTLSVRDGRPEKEFTLDWARRLKPLLEADGWTVYLTRTNDTDLALSNRVAFAEAHHADYFISLHFNSAAPDKKQSGLETYCLTPTGMPSTITRGYADPWNENLPDNAFDAQNLQFAVRLQSAILQVTGEDDRGVRRARFIGVLRGQNRPSILIEGGYLSNPAEAAKIENSEFRQKLAEAVAGALAGDPGHGK